MAKSTDTINCCAIEQFIHCRMCMAEIPAGVSPKEWSQLEAGFTKDNTMQVWCRRHDAKVLELVVTDVVEDCK
jgi:hypothetical protein